MIKDIFDISLLAQVPDDSILLQPSPSKRYFLLKGLLIKENYYPDYPEKTIFEDQNSKMSQIVLDYLKRSMTITLIMPKWKFFDQGYPLVSTSCARTWWNYVITMILGRQFLSKTAGFPVSVYVSEKCPSQMSTLLKIYLLAFLLTYFNFRNKCECSIFYKSDGY